MKPGGGEGGGEKKEESRMVDVLCDFGETV